MFQLAVSCTLLSGYNELKTLSYQITLIGPIGADVRLGRELSTLQIVSNNLDRSAKVYKGLSLYDDQLRNALRIQGLNLQKQIEDLNRTLKER